MSEYIFVERPFLDHLRALGWEVIDQGCFAIPSNPAVSLRGDFREVTLRRIFVEAVGSTDLPPRRGRQGMPGADCSSLRLASWTCSRAGCG